jgi:phospholipid/cholesterol/gamma-HCH transport system substrate-binding protein
VHLYDGDEAKVTFTVETDIPLSQNVTAAIRYRNLIGQRYLSLSDSPGGAGTLAPHSTIPLARTSPALNLNALFDGFKPLLTGLSPDEVNTLSYEIVQVLQGEGGTVTSLLTNVGSLSNTFADRDKLIGEVIDNLNAVLGPIDQHDADLGNTLAQLQRFISGLAADRTAIGNSLVSINNLADTTAGFLSSIRPDLKGDIANLGVLASRLNTSQSRQLITDFLKVTPNKLAVTEGASTYGSWLNQYLCAVTIIAPNGTKLPTYMNQAPRCN